jgi:hypothetical protein
MLNIRKAFFSDREVINLIRQTPIIQDALQAQIDAEEARELDARNRVLDALAANGQRLRQIDKDIAAQHPRHDATLAAWRVEADKLGALSAERDQLQRREGELCSDLSRNGEAPLDRALMQFWEGIAIFSSQISTIESDLAHARRDNFDGKYPAWRAQKLEDLAYVKDRLQRTQAALKVATKWIAARVPPREQIARVESLMASLAE